MKAGGWITSPPGLEQAAKRKPDWSLPDFLFKYHIITSRLRTMRHPGSLLPPHPFAVF